MNFFEHQDAAKRRTGRLVMLFIAAVVGILLAINVVTFILVNMAEGWQQKQEPQPATPRYSTWDLDAPPSSRSRPRARQYDVERPEPSASEGAAGAILNYNHWGVNGVVSLGVLALMGMGMAYKSAQLSRGGAAVAELLGGEPVSSATPDPAERQLLNVVEEMSIASGVPMPRVYVLDNESGINAFAAGTTTTDAVIGVTRGAINELTRDELQGVIAHEYSHILNGDMRLNLRMISMLHGILLIALAGYIVVRMISITGTGSRRRSSNDKDSGAGIMVAILVAGIALIVIGSIGTFFAKLIQAAVSRQREYLADASAVQFTRNPGGIASALKKLGARSRHSRMESPQAMAMAHLFFGSAGGFSFENLMATHPPLVDRIRAIEPTFDGNFPQASSTPPIMERYGSWRTPDRTGAGGSAAPRGGFKPPMGAASMGAAMGFAMMAQQGTQSPGRGPDRSPIALEPERLMENAGVQAGQQLEFASLMISAMPESLVQAAHDLFSARSLVFAMLLDPQNATVRTVQLETIRMQADDTCANESNAMSQQLAELGPAARLPLLNLSLPSLRQMSQSQYDGMQKITRLLIEADQQVSLPEYMIYKLLQMSGPSVTRSAAVKFTAVTAVADEVAVLLGAIISQGGIGPQSQTVFDQAMARLGISRAMPPASQLGLSAVDAALSKLATASPPIHRRLMEAAAQCVIADGQVTVEEAEMLRAVGAVLGCPLPANLAMLGG